MEEKEENKYLKQPYRSNIFKNGYEIKNRIFKKFIVESELKTNSETEISFVGCTFKQPFVLEKITAKSLHFYDCVFEKEAFVLKSNLGLGFTKCNFLNSLHLTSNVCRGYTVLRDIKAEELKIDGEYNILQIVSSNIENVKIVDINSKSSLKDSKIEFLVENVVGKLTITPHSTFSQIFFKGSQYKNVHFEGTFNNHIVFENNTICDSLHFESSTVNYRIDLEKGSFKYVNFYRSNFDGLVFISDFDSESEDFSRFLEIESLSIHSCNFNKDFTVWLSRIKYISLSNNLFNQQFQFNNYLDRDKFDKSNDSVMFRMDGINRGVIILERGYFDLTLGGINFGDIHIKDSLAWSIFLVDIDNKGSITLDNVESCDFFTINSSNSGKLNFFNTDIDKFNEIVIADSNIQGVNFYKYPKKIRSYSSNPKVGYGINDKSRNTSNLRHIYNQLKQVARKKGDIDIANKYQSLEYKQLLLNKGLGFDKLLLFLNWLSNNNGRSWFRGVLFTLIVAFLFFCIYLNVLGISFDYTSHLKEYVLFITSFPKLQLEKYAETNISWQVSLVIWLSRIFISYGIYQTVAAFRKYGKG